jgi:hypothetical protein
MPHSPLIRLAGPLCVFASVLIVFSQLLRLGVGWLAGPDSTSTAMHTVTYAIALLGMAALLLALAAIYTREATSLGRLGLVGYLTATLGTLLVAGDWWFEAFVVPEIATQAPEILTGSPGRSLLTGVVTTTAFFAIGWTLFGIAALRSGVFGRPAAVLLIVGGLTGVLALSTPWQIPLAVAIGWIGVAFSRLEAMETEES